MDEGIYQQAGDDVIQIGRTRDLYIDTHRSPVGVPFQAPTVPRYFVPRPEVSQALMDYLTAEAPSGALVVSAVHGLGGIGKTTLIAALAHTPDVQARFPDGVLWVTLGQQPDILSLLAGWIQALGDYDFRPTVIESAEAHLRTLLHDKACLLVVDDAWQADHVRPFLVGGPRCRLVVTTRDAALARKVGARLYDLDVMTQAQALALFQARLGPLDGDREQATALARELGYLPLALELAAAQVEAGLSWAELLDTFQRQADLAALDLDEATYRNESLRLCFRLSLEQLSPDDQDAFAWLGVLPEDARLNPAMAVMLWDQPEAGARKRLRWMRDKALLKAVGEDRYTLHDLLHDEAKLRLAERMPLPEAHAVLLARYRQKAPDEQWHHLPDDGYIYAHLTWHMEQAGQPKAVHALLQMETQEGRNAWYQAREALGQTAGYLDDVRRAWRLAEEEFAIRHSPFAIGLQCRYALITASLNSLAGNIHPKMLTALVKQDIWTPAQGLAYARQIPKLGQRAKALAALTSHLPESLRGEVLQESVAAAHAIRDRNDRARALAELAPHLPEVLLREALAVVQEIQHERVRTWALVGMAPHLPESLRREVLREALALARMVEGEPGRARALARLFPHLPEADRAEALREALAAAREIRDEYDRAQALASLIPHLPGRLREGVLQEALTAAWEIRDEYDRAHALASLIPHLPERLRGKILQEALALARMVEGEPGRARALARLAPHLPVSLLWEALAAAREIRDEYDRAQALTSLLPRLAELGYPQEALAAAREIWDEDDRARALASLIPRLSEAERVEALQESLAAAREIRDEDDRARALASLIPHLSESLLWEALEVVLSGIWDENDRAPVLAGLPPHLPEAERAEALREALALARRIEDVWTYLAVRVGLVPRLAELGHLQEAEMTVQQFAKGLAGWDLVSMACLMGEIGLWEMAEDTLEFVNDDDQNRAAILTGLAPYLSESWMEKALAEARGIEPEKWRAVALIGLATRLVELSATTVYPLWRETLSILAARTRHDLLADLYALEPVIAVLGGEEAVAETFHAIQDVGRWWP